MADDWKPGDLALCVSTAPFVCDCGCQQTGESCPPRGSVREVLFIGKCGDEPTDTNEEIPCDAPILMFGIGEGGAARRFRKIQPHTPDEQDEETIRLLNLVEA